MYIFRNIYLKNTTYLYIIKSDDVAKTIKILQKYSIYHILGKHLILNGIDNDESMRKFLNDNGWTLSDTVGNKVYNAWDDVLKNPNMDKIPSLFK